MKLNDLKPNPGARKQKKRVGRGPGGTDKTAGRGHKGQASRSGSSLASSGAYKSEGGQTPMIRRLPKRGFNNPMKQEFHLVNLSDLANFGAGATVGATELEGARLIKKVKHPIKLLARGEVSVALNITVHAASQAAIAAVQAAGGSVTVLGVKPTKTTEAA
jgi:large subunit ribosomal protein L15